MWALWRKVIVVGLRDDLKLALDHVSFAEKLGIVPDEWQRNLLRSGSDRVLLNCCRQSGKSTMTAVIALHRALYHPGSLILCLIAPVLMGQNHRVRAHPSVRSGVSLY